MKSILIILFLATMTFNCSKNSASEIDCGLPPQNWFSINLQDENENSLFNNIYSQDSINLFNENDTIPLAWWANEKQMQIGFEDIKSSKNYFLELSSLDTDTLWIQWSSTGASCKSYFLDSLRYNNVAISSDKLIGKVVILTKY